MTDLATQRLPFEVQEQIIDLLAHNCRHLRNLTFVCNSWRLRCYRTLFRSLQLQESSIVSLGDVLSSPFSALAILIHVRHIWLGSHDTSVTWDNARWKVLQQILVLLDGAKVTDLTVLKSAQLLFSLGLTVLIPSHLSRIKSLHLSNLHFNNPMDFALFFTGFPSLQYIVVKNVTVPSSWTPPAMFFATSSPETRVCSGRYSLSIHFHDNVTIHQSMRWRRGDTNLPMNIHDVASLYSACAVHQGRYTLLDLSVRSVSRLEILVKNCPDEVWHDPLDRIDLSTATALRHITAGSSRCVLSLLTWIPTLLGQVPESASPKIIEIAFASSRQFRLDQPAIRLLSTILSGRPQFKSLEVVHFMAFATLGDREVEDKISRIITNEFWHQKHLLRFSFSP